MKRAIVLALTTICAAALFAVPAQGKARKAQTTRPGRTGVCVVVIKPESGSRRSAPQSRGGRRSPRCRGPRGFRGPRGRAGPRGARGADGRDGSNGTDGSNGATGPAGPKGDKGDKGDPGAPAGAGRRYAMVAAAETTADATFRVLPTPGPSVTVTVPASGLISIIASSKSAGGDGAVSVFEDGVQLAGQSISCAGPAGTLFDTLGDLGEPGETYGTPGTLNALTLCATTGAPGPVIFQTSPGVHTYELRYAIAACGCGNGDPATFSERKLWVTPLP